MESAATHSAQILIVEDEKIIAKDLEVRLRRMNYQVVGAVTNSDDCLALLEECTADLILMDIMIDGPRDGIETAHLVRSKYDIPIIFLTAYADESTFQRAKLSDPFGYILKPFQERELDLSIQTVLQKHRLERQIRENEARYRLLFESTQEAIVVLDDDACLQDGNLATEQLFGRTKPDLIGQSLMELSGFESKDSFFRNWDQHLADGEGQGRYKVRRPDGSVRYVDYSLKMGYMPHRHLAVLRDVTQKVQDRREIEALARIPLEAPSPILRFSPEGHLLYANRQAEHLLEAWGSRGALHLPEEVQQMLAEMNLAEPHANLVCQAGVRYYQLLAVYVTSPSVYINIYATDVTDQHYSESLVAFQRDVLEQVAVGQILQQTLARLVDGLEALLPDMSPVLIWRESALEGYQCVAGASVDEGEMFALFAGLNELPTAEGEDALNLNTGSPLHHLQLALQSAADGRGLLQASIHTLPAYARTEAQAWLVMFWPVGRAMTNREISVCKLALRLSATAFERDATFQRLYQQSLAFENINDAIILTDPEGLVTEWSPSAERIFHCSKQDIVGKPLAQTFSFVIDPHAHAPLRGGLERQVAQFTRPDGGQGWTELSQVDMLDPTGNLIGRLQVARDITQKKYVEQQLNISEQHLKAIFDNSVQSFVLLDMGFKVEAFNRQAERWVADFGRRRLRKGASITQFWPTGYAAKLKQCLRAASGGEVMGYEDFLITQDDQNVWLEISLMPVRDAEGKIMGICLTALDIGERKTNEQTLARSEARFRSLVQNSSDLVLLLDAEGRVEYASESSARITGYSSEQLQGARITRHVHERDKVRLLEALRKSEDREETSVQLEYRFIKADGQVLTLESVITNELDNPAIRALVVNTRDITERKQVEESLRNLVRGNSPYSDEDYVVFLADNLAVSLYTPNVALITFGEDYEQHARALVVDGNPAKEIDLGKPGPFTQSVLEEGFLHLPSIKGSKYASDPILKRFKNARYAMGVVMQDYEGKNIGLLAVGGTEENAHHSQAVSENMLKLVSLRAANELARMRMTRALQENEANLMALVENTHDAIWSIDRTYRLMWMNNSFRQRFAHLFRDGIEAGDSVLELMSEEDARLWREHYELALGGLRHTQEVAVMTARARAEFEVSFNPILSAERTITGVSVFARDITERKKAEQALRESEANLSALIENTDDIIYSLDQSFRLVTTNSSFGQALYELGAPPYPKEVQQIGPVAFGEAWGDLYRRAFEGEKFRQELPVELAGELRAIEASFNPILTKDRAVTGISVMARDVTERKRAEDELKRTNFELDSFVYRASHDLRAPLRSVLGLVNLIKIEKDENQKKAFLTLAEKSINKLDTFISDLTHFSRNTRLEITAAEIDFTALISECLENLRYMEKAERVAPILDLQQKGPFYSDPQRIAIILQNLVSNAIKYQRTDIESFVRISIHTNETEGVLTIEDNGKGIQEEYLHRIFEMFFRASEDSYGSGLGLYITHQVVEKLGGRVHVDSVYGEGTRFVITLPNRGTPSEPAPKETLEHEFGPEN